MTRPVAPKPWWWIEGRDIHMYILWTVYTYQLCVIEEQTLDVILIVDIINKKDAKTKQMDRTFQLYMKVFLSYNHEIRLLYNLTKIMLSNYNQ